MIAGMLPNSVYAVESVPDVSSVDQEQENQEQQNNQDQQETTKEDQQTLSEEYYNVRASDGESYHVPLPSTSKQTPIEEIIKDSKMYVTLRDGQNRIVSSTHPGYEPNAYYKNGGKVALGAKMKVNLEFASIKEASLPDGISEEGYYYLNLPKEVVPIEKDEDLGYLIDPEEPIELFHNGSLRAFGGIYTNHGDSEKPWRLKMHFVNVVDEIEISGFFQYMATVNEDLNYDTTYDHINFGGAGDVSFTTEEEKVEKVNRYQLNVTGSWDENQTGGGQYIIPQRIQR